jgi:hypothetical protein
MRFVVGLEGELNNGWGWEVSANYGKFEQEFEDRNRLIVTFLLCGRGQPGQCGWGSLCSYCSFCI